MTRVQPVASKEEQEPEQLKKAEEEQSSFRRFQWNYLLVYLIVMGTRVWCCMSSDRQREGGRERESRSVLTFGRSPEADWLQGPYVYALYEAYGFVKQVQTVIHVIILPHLFTILLTSLSVSQDIAILFIAGFSSSMVFGTFIGSIADK
jgi:hypothetical protein